MKRAALYLASLAAVIGGMAQPAFAQTAVSTDATGGFVGFTATLTSPNGSVRRGLIQAMTCVDTTGVYTGCAGSGGSGGAVTNAGTFAVQNTAATPAGTNNIGSITGNAGYLEASSLAASSTTPQTARVAPVWATKFACSAQFLTTGGTVTIQKNTGATVSAGPTTAPANTTTTITVPITGLSTDGYICLAQSGATAPTAFRLESSFLAN